MERFREVIVLDDDQEPPGGRKKWDWFGTETISDYGNDRTYVAWRLR
jgi:hypothetical protein